MSKQRIVKDEIWSDDWFYELDPTEKLVWMFLLTNERGNVAGIYKISTRWASNLVGLDRNVFEEILKRFETHGKILRNGDWIVLVNFSRHQSSSPKIAAGIKRIVEDLPEDMKIFLGLEHIEKVKKVSRMDSTKRDRIVQRDGGECLKCKSTKDLEVDHIKPICLGGGNEDENLQTLCRKCHQEKTSEDLREIPYPTLLNSTLLNSTLPNEDEDQKFSEMDMKMATLLMELIKQNNPDWKLRGKVETWAAHIEKLHRIDERSYQQIEYMIRWTQQDSFWQQNILSTAKLREKFNDLIPKVKASAVKVHMQRQEALKPKFV